MKPPHSNTHPPLAEANTAQTGIVLTNVGSPAAPTPRALRPYLAQFLSDARIVELPRWLWLPILYGILLQVRPRRSAKLYARTWTEEGSPLKSIFSRQVVGLRQQIRARTGHDIPVVMGMRYGQPSIALGLQQLRDAGVQRILVMPLYPQYSATTTAAAFDAVFDELKRWRWVPELRTVQHYHDDPLYISALAYSIDEARAEHGQPERLLFSFHGIPRSYFLKGDPYYCECHKTARLVAEKLKLADGMWDVSFQSQFGPSAWLQPYTEDTLKAWGAAGITRAHVICPGFSADCLETLDEVAREGRDAYEHAGGKGFHYIPALNDCARHIEALTSISLRHLQGWLDLPVEYCLPDATRMAAHRQRLKLDI